jgi:rsbT antagonist protein RsbS
VGEGWTGDRIPLNLVRGCIVATMRADLTHGALEQLRTDLLECVRDTGARRIVLDASAVELMDTEDFRALERTVAAAALMGARTVVAGLQPGVVSALVELGLDGGTLETALDLDDGFARLDDAADATAEAEDAEGEAW